MMSPEDFNSKKLEELGWRQGTILGGKMSKIASQCCAMDIDHSDDDWLIVTSHDCDIANFQLKKEPYVEVVRAQIVVNAKVPNKQMVWGRNPRSLSFSGTLSGAPVVLACSIHDRWLVPREKFLVEAPSAKKIIAKSVTNIIAKWMAKRYIRSAFPSEFDARWKGEKSKNLKIWTNLLRKYNQYIQAVYIYVDIVEELAPDKSYTCNLLVVIPEELTKEDDFHQISNEIDCEINAFWNRFAPGILCDEINVLGTNDISLADISLYQRFDADWLSFSDDDMPVTPIMADFIE